MTKDSIAEYKNEWYQAFGEDLVCSDYVSSRPDSIEVVKRALEKRDVSIFKDYARARDAAAARFTAPTFASEEETSMHRYYLAWNAWHRGDMKEARQLGREFGIFQA